MTNIELIKHQLLSPKIDERRKAIKVITSEKIMELGPQVYELYIIEKSKNKSWEFQCDLIESIGVLNYTPAKSIMESICRVNLERDMITAKAAGCFLRLSRTDLHDINPIKELLNFGGYAVVAGVLITLGIDKMSFSSEEIIYLIDFVKGIPVKREKGYSDIRTGLVNACAGWEKSKVILDFLYECEKDEYSPLTKVAKNSLKGKYSSF